MKAIATIIAGSVLALSTAAHAAPPATQAPAANNYEGSQADATFVSTKTRADVRSEAIAALHRGEILTGELYPLDFASPMRGKSRAQVKAELASAIRNGELRAEQ